MLEQVAVGRWSLDAYRGVVPAHILDELVEAAKPLRGARILPARPRPRRGVGSQRPRSRARALPPPAAAGGGAAATRVARLSLRAKAGLQRIGVFHGWGDAALAAASPMMACARGDAPERLDDQRGTRT